MFASIFDYHSCFFSSTYEILKIIYGIHIVFLYFDQGELKMAIAISLETTKRKKKEYWQVLAKVSGILKRMWWHIHAYLTIFAIMGLTLGSLLYLHLHNYYLNEKGDTFKPRERG